MLKLSGDEDENEIQPLVSKQIIVGSRKSKLAMIQTRIVIDQLRKHYPSYEFQIKNIDTIGDNILDKPLAQIGEKALFTRELEEELLAKNIDIIVHSLKDMPTKLPDQCCIGAILRREDPTDSLVFRRDLSESSFQNIETILKSSSSNIKTFGTSSMRRIAQLKSLSSEIMVKDVRGNLNTRLDKLDNHLIHGFDCLVLATAGLKRAGFEDRISLRLDDHWYHAVSQGALGIECRSDDFAILQMLEPLVDEKSALECTAERVLMKCLEGGCSVPIGVKIKWTAPFKLTLKAKVLSTDGQKSISSESTMDLDDNNHDEIDQNFSLSDYTDIYIKCNRKFAQRLKNSIVLGRRVAKEMISLGVKQILRQQRS